jgi:hypothetical protein
MSFRLSFHLAPLGLTGAHWLDDPPDVSSADSTQADWVDVEHQPTDLAVVTLWAWVATGGSRYELVALYGCGSLPGLAAVV